GPRSKRQRLARPDDAVFGILGFGFIWCLVFGIWCFACFRYYLTPKYMSTTSDSLASFIDAAVWHGSLDRAEAILTEHPEIATRDIHAAAILGDDATVRRFLALDPGNATVKGGP